MIIIPKTSCVGCNIKSCLPDHSKIPDHGKTVFLNHLFWVKTEKKSCRKWMKLSLNYLYFDINVMRKCLGRRLVNIWPFSATETSVLGKISQGVLSDFFRSWQIIERQQTSLNINSLTILLLDTGYFYFIVHKNINTQLIFSMLQTCAFLPNFHKAYYHFF